MHPTDSHTAIEGIEVTPIGMSRLASYQMVPWPGIMEAFKRKFVEAAIKAAFNPVSDTKPDRFEVVIRPDDGMKEDHADLLRKRLLDDGFHDHAVDVRSVGGGD